MNMWHLLLLCLAFASTCTPPQTGSARETAGAAAGRFALRGELVRKADGLAYELDGGELWSRQAQAAVPYRVVCNGPPALVTTFSAELEVTTLALGDETYMYKGLYPLVVEPPLVVLAGLPEADEAVLVRTVMLDSDGLATWSGNTAALLLPVADPPDCEVAYFAQAGAAGTEHGFEAELLYPWGEAAQLLAIDAASGQPAWNVPLKPLSAVAGVELWALTDSYGLLSLQYDYNAFEFIAFKRADGGITMRHWLDGQPATVIVYPGGFNEPLPLQLSGNIAGVAVYPLGEEPAVWNFDLKTGELKATAFTPPARAAREENELPAAWDGAPSPTAPPFPQGLLPVQSGTQWRIPALTDGAGNVLVVTAADCQWLPGAAIAEAADVSEN